MTAPEENAPKIHYICQTYAQKQGKSSERPGLKIDKQFQYTSAAQAENRAEREFEAGNCLGADAYMVTEDPSSGEVGSPTFLTRLGEYPEFDDF